MTALDKILIDAEIKERTHKHDPEIAEVNDTLNKLINGKITNIGFVKEIKEGGLAIEYEKDNLTYRLILGYNELGEWIEFHEQVGRQP